MDGLVSVITPTYNRAYCLGRTLDSALGQTYPRLEIVVVDDGSTDATRELVQGPYGRDPRVKYIQQENQGVSAARNRGMRAAQGDYLAFLDSDDIWKPWKLQAQLACLERLPQAGMIWSDMEAVDPEGRTISPRYLQTMYHAYRWFSYEQLFSEKHTLREAAAGVPDAIRSAVFHAGDIYSQMIMGNLVHTSTVVLRRERYEKVREFNEEYKPSGEDYDFHLRVCREGPVAFLDLPTIEYQVGMADRLTQYLYPTAVHFLDTITRAVQRDRDRITLPPHMLNTVFAEANAWVAEELVLRGERRDAARHFARSLSYKKWQPRIYAQLARCALPRPLERALYATYRRVRSRKAATQ